MQKKKWHIGLPLHWYTASLPVCYSAQRWMPCCFVFRGWSETERSRGILPLSRWGLWHFFSLLLHHSIVQSWFNRNTRNTFSDSTSCRQLSKQTGLWVWAAIFNSRQTRHHLSFGVGSLKLSESESLWEGVSFRTFRGYLFFYAHLKPTDEGIDGFLRPPWWEMRRILRSHILCMHSAQQKLWAFWARRVRCLPSGRHFCCLPLKLGLVCELAKSDAYITTWVEGRHWVDGWFSLYFD